MFLYRIKLWFHIRFPSFPPPHVPGKGLDRYCPMCGLKVWATESRCWHCAKLWIDSRRCFPGAG